MKCTTEELKQIATGAIRATEENGAVFFHRFTEEQEELYRNRWTDFYIRSFATAGIKLFFETDSEKMTLKVTTSPGSSRSYFSIDVLVDGEAVGYIDNFKEKDMTGDYTQKACPLGDFAKTFSLGEGMKKVCIHLPWSVKTGISELALDDGAYVRPVKHSKKLLAFGDSITHGYDAMRPSNRYIARLADVLDAEELNKAIGGEVFYPELAKAKEQFMPDYVTVAYGTNDWSGKDRETFLKDCRAFYSAVSEAYPDAKIFAITPIWRKDKDEERPFGAFAEVEGAIRESVSGLFNVTVIPGESLVPEDASLYGDLRLHPNDEGFRYYFENLHTKIKEQI